MTDPRTRRLNEERFSRTAEVFAASGVTGTVPELDLLLRLTAAAPADLLLDVACGPGRLLRAFAPYVRKAVGLDLTMEMLGIVRRGRGERTTGVVEVVRGEGERLPFRDAAFTIVSTTTAIHHFADPRRVLEEMVRVCRRAGRIAVRDLVGSADEARRARQNEIERLRDPSHVELHSAAGLEALLTGCGLIITGRASGVQMRELGEWCRLAATPAKIVPRVREMLRRSVDGDLAGIQPALVDGEWRFHHHWLTLVASKP
ncbi:MAG TPA: methyltransferase domain-containing protein [bacterium]|nr:methyltransferase domain-containing protein [bacterium]